MSLVFSPTSADVNEEVTATITFKDDDVAAVYIDWDDGADNRENANYQWLEFDRPIKSATATHTYTANGTYKPIIQTISSKGFVSRYYSKDSSAPTGVAPWTQNNNINTIVISDKNATGIIRVQNKEVLSGIDNSIFDKPKDIYVMAPPLASAYGGAQPQLEITAEAHRPANLASGSNIDIGASVETIQFTADAGDAGGNRGFTKLNPTGNLISAIKKVVYKNPKALSSTYETEKQFNQLKIFIVASGSDGNFYPITYVSDGIPVKKADDSRRNVTLDFSQSRAASSTESIGTYYRNIGKSWFNPINKWSITGSPNTLRISEPSGTTATANVSYTYMPRPNGLSDIGYNLVDSNSDYVLAMGSGTNYLWVSGSNQEPRSDQFTLTDTNQFFDQYHLVQTNVKTSSTAKYSYIDGFNGTFRLTPFSWWVSGSQYPVGGGVKTGQSPTKFHELSGSTTNLDYSQHLTPEGYNNLSGTLTGQVRTQQWNKLGYYDWKNQSREATEYFIVLSDTKMDKVFLECSPYSQGLQSHLASALSGTRIAGVSYLSATNKDTPTCDMEWKPLEFEDYTVTKREYRDTTNDTYVEKSNSLSKNGFIKYDVPDDWSAVSFGDTLGMASGSMWGQSEGAGVAPVVGTTNAYEIPVRMTCRETGTGVNGKWARFDTVVFLDSNTYSVDDIGKYKFGALWESGSMGGGTVAGQWYWCASGAAGAGYDGTNMYLQIGAKQYDGSAHIQYGTFQASTVYEFRFRRCNAWEVFDGTSKIWSDNPAGVAGANLQAPDAMDGRPWPNRYCFMSGSAVGANLATDWGNNDLYALKIAVSGAHFPSGTGNNSKIGNEIWNITPASESSSEIIKEIDDHAYSINKLPLTSDIEVTRARTFYQAITRKGKVYICATGLPLQTISFSSVALGDTSDTISNQFDKMDPSSLYGQLRTIRKLQENVRRIYWDLEQKDGTYVRFFGIPTNVSETTGVGSPRAVVNYNFNMTIEEVAIIDGNGTLLTDLFPIGGIEDVRDYT
jgi:hypothetical protein